MIHILQPIQTNASLRMLSQLFVAVIAFSLTLFAGKSAFGQTPITYTSSSSWTCPAGVTSITVECWGAGGGGGQRSNIGAAGGGGGGAYASSTLTVIPGNSYSITVGTGGSGTTGTKNGGNSSFASSVIALGGNGATNNNTIPGLGGTATGSTGTIKYNGANGTTGATNGGSGGGAAGRNGNASGATGNGLYSGNGGAGRAGSQGAGTAGFVFGAGGGGALRASSSAKAGGAGANGLVIITISDAIWQNPIFNTSNISSATPFTIGDIIAPNLSVSGISKGSTPSAVTATNIYEASGWTSGSLNANSYFEFTLTPASGYMLNLATFNFIGTADSDFFGSPPTSFAVRSSRDGYASNIGVASASSNIDLSGISYQGLTTATTFRVYAWNGSDFFGTSYYGINSFAFRGELTPIAPPTLSSFLPSNGCPNSDEEVVITGTNFYGVSAVKFNGIDASFTVNSTTQITAVMPAGATTGIIAVTTVGGTANSANNFIVYEADAALTLLSDNFNDGNTTGWTITNGGWSASASSPLTGSHSLHGINSYNFWSSVEKYISIPFNHAPVDLTEARTIWRFNVSSSGGTSASNNGIYIWLSSHTGDADNDPEHGYALKFEGNNIIFGVKTSSWSPLISYNAGSGKKGIEIIRTPSGVWSFSTDNDGDFDALVLRDVVTHATYTSASYFGAFIDNPDIFDSDLNLRIDDIQITQEGKCHPVYYSQSNGNSNASIWSRERIGTAHSQVGGEEISFVTQNGHTVVPTGGSWVLENLIIETGGTLDFTTSAVNYPVSIHGNLSNQGTLTSNEEILSFVGDAAQTVQSNSKLVLNDIVVNNGHSLTLPSNVKTEVKPNGVITLSNGVLYTSDSLLLSSRPTGTASIGVINTGSSVSGKVAMERYIPNMSLAPIGGNGSWVAVGTPIQGATIQHWNNTITTTGYSGSDFPPPGYNFNNIQWYNQAATGNISNGYTGVLSNSETLHTDRGYFIYMLANLAAPENLLSVRGNIQQGTFNDTISYTNTGNPAADGWNLKVNRYPSEVDFKSIAESGAGAITSYHLFNAEQNNYKVYHTNSTGNAPRYIASGQAFFVQATAANSYLQYREAFKTNQGTAFERELGESSFAAIKFIKANNNADECVLNFNDNATSSFENEYDAVKLSSPEPTAAECALVSTDGVRMTIDSRPIGYETSISIPVYVEMPVSGTYRLKIDQTYNLPFGSCLFVEDLITGNTIPLEQGQELVITHTGNYSGNRFLIHASPSIALTAADADCFNAHSGSITVDLPDGDWTIALADTLGNTISASQNGSLFEQLAAGEYIISATNALSNCPTSNKSITLFQPAEMVLNHLSSLIDQCNINGNAAIEWEVSNATQYDYTLTNDLGEVITTGNAASGNVWIEDLNAGVYTLDVHTYCNTQSFTTSLIDSNAVTAEILSDNILITLFEGTTQTITVEQTNQQAHHIIWSLSNGYIHQGETFTYEFMEPGEYVLTMVAQNDHCSAQDVITIVIDRAVSINEEMTENLPLSFQQTTESLELYLNISSNDATTVSVYDISGRVVWSMNTSTRTGKNISIGTGSFASGVYVLKATVGQSEIFNKKFVNP